MDVLLREQGRIVRGDRCGFLRLSPFGAQLTELSEAQARDLGVAQEGPYKAEH
jgi:hypothetical protein